MKKVAVVHIGLHKTGSTSIQGLLKKNEYNSIAYIPKILRNENVNLKIVNHASLAWNFNGDERVSWVKEKIEEFKEEIKNKKILLLSSEDFSLVLSNQETKKNLEEFLYEYEIIYIVYFRNTKDRDIVLINEIKKHWKTQGLSKLSRYLRSIRELFRLKKGGKIKYSMYKSKYANFFFSSHCKLIREFRKNSRGKFLFFEYNKNVDIFKPFIASGLVRNIPSSKIYYNRSKIWFVLKFLNIFFKNKKIFFRKDRELKNIHFIKKKIQQIF